MFDFAWSEIALIAGVALVVIGPKDLPVAIRAISGFVKKARRMAGEFQTHVDEMMRDADLKDVKDSLNEIRNFDFRGSVEKAIDPDHALRDTFSGLETGTAASASVAGGEAAASEPVPDEYDARANRAGPGRRAAFHTPGFGAVRGGTETAGAAATFHSARRHAPTAAGMTLLFPGSMKILRVHN
jgi:Tat protein translocase TatB subunit